MPVVEKQVILNVPAESVVPYLTTPPHLTTLCPNMIEVIEFERQKPGLWKFAWVYKMMSARIFGEAEIHETKHNQQLEMRFWGGIQGGMVWQFTPLDEGVLVAVQVDYATPAPLLKKHTEDAILRHNELAVEHMLVNLRTLLDAQQAENKEMR